MSDQESFALPPAAAWEMLAEDFRELGRRADIDAGSMWYELERLEMRAAKLFAAACEAGAAPPGWQTPHEHKLRSAISGYEDQRGERVYTLTGLVHPEHQLRLGPVPSKGGLFDPPVRGLANWCWLLDWLEKRYPDSFEGSYEAARSFARKSAGRQHVSAAERCEAVVRELKQCATIESVACRLVGELFTNDPDDAIRYRDADFVPTDYDREILLALSKRQTRCKTDAVEVRGCGQRKVRTRLPELEKHRLVDRVEGKRSGWAITQTGRELLTDSAEK